MKNLYEPLKVLLLLVLIPVFSQAQDILSGGKVTGNLQVDAQYYSTDSKLGITDTTLNFKKFGMNGFANILYSNGDFNAGLRFEGYLNPMLGFDPRYEGVGIPYWFASYKLGTLEMTAGHFYEQFGSGLVLRSWEEWTLGYDNNIYGFDARFEPVNGIMLKGVVGVQRYFWEPYERDSRGIIKGIDGDFSLNDMITSLTDSKLKVTLGGSFVSKYENPPVKSFSRDSAYSIYDTIFSDTINWVQRTTYEYNLPHNVGSWAGRVNLAYKGFNLYTEYAQKSNDPNEGNNYINKKGQAVYSTISYSTKGLGILLATKWIDNMGFKSKLTESGNPPMLDINYLPAISKEHLYSFASMYPYATQKNGEFGIQGQLNYNIPKKSRLGGKYGTDISLNYTTANEIKKTQVADNIPIDSTGTEGYSSTLFSKGNLVYYKDFNILISHKFSGKVKAQVSYLNQVYNLHVIEDNVYDDQNIVYANIGVLDLTYKFTAKNSLRMETQGLWTKQDDGNWVALLFEYNVSPSWFFSVQDEYNYGNPEDAMQVHYYNVSFGYTQKTNRISLRYGQAARRTVMRGRGLPLCSCFNRPDADNYKLILTVKRDDVMKFKIVYLFLLAGFITFAWTACDKIDDPLIVTGIQKVPLNVGDTLSDSVIVTEKHVLLEDFTGHKCVNCAEASIAAHQWAEQDGHMLIIYSIHSGYYAFPDATGNYTADFTCPASDELYADFSVFANPTGMIDRVTHNGTNVLNFSDWNTVVQQELAKPNQVNMQLKNSYYPNYQSVKIDVSSTFISQQDGKYRLVVFIAEDHIVAPQKNNNPAIGPSPDWLDYEHRNILRGSVNGTYGEYISNEGNVQVGETYQKSYFYPINPEWVTANCKIIAYVTNEDTKEVLQVAELGIKTE